MRQITAIIIGAGNRGADAYASYACQFPNELKIVGVAEPRNDRRTELAKIHSIPSSNCFPTWEEMFKKGRIADCAFICTPDNMHYQPVMKALSLGYNVLCEKPMSKSKEELYNLQKMAKSSKKILSVCHVLRYSSFFSQIKHIIDSGVIGQLVTIQHIESVGFWHMAHSFVRGNWKNSDETSPMFLAKCCHDTDILSFLIGAKCISVSSFGSLMIFCKENKPKDAPEFCLDGCQYRDSCPYYAPKFYLEHPKAKEDHFDRIISLDTSSTGIINALKKGPYGRCVYNCDNSVVDHQVINLLYENGVTVNMTMSAFTQNCERVINIMGSHGQIRGNMESNEIEVYHFSSGLKTVYTVQVPKSGHSGSDTIMMKDFLACVRNEKSDLTDVDVSIESHIIALAAEESRVNGGKVINLF